MNSGGSRRRHRRRKQTTWNAIKELFIHIYIVSFGRAFEQLPPAPQSALSLSMFSRFNRDTNSPYPKDRQSKSNFSFICWCLRSAAEVVAFCMDRVGLFFSCFVHRFSISLESKWRADLKWYYILLIFFFFSSECPIHFRVADWILKFRDEFGGSEMFLFEIGRVVMVDILSVNWICTRIALWHEPLQQSRFCVVV